MQTVVLVIDQLSACELSCFGAHRKTPTIDKIAAHSDIFTQLFSTDTQETLSRFDGYLDATTIKISDSHTPSKIEDLITKSDGESIFIKLECESKTAVELDEFLQPFSNQFFSEMDQTVNFIFISQRGREQLLDRSEGSSSQSEMRAHLSFFVRSAGQLECRRRTQLMNSNDLYELIKNLNESRDAYSAVRDRIHHHQIEYDCGSTHYTRSQSWLVLKQHTTSDDQQHVALYHLPEDIWEVHDVSAQYHELIEAFLQTGTIPG